MCVKYTLLDIILITHFVYTNVLQMCYIKLKILYQISL